MHVAVLGSGNGGCAAAFDFAQHGHTVNVFDFEAFPVNIAAIAAKGGLSSEGDLSGFASTACAGHDIEQALDGAELVLVVGPAYSTESFGEACRPFLKKGQVVVVCPGSSGVALAFKQSAGLQLQDDSVVVADTGTLPYAVRILEPGRIHVYLKLRAAVALAALPARHTARVLGMLADVYPCLTPAANVLFTALANANPVIHPAVTIGSAAQIERTGGELLFYEEGITPSVGRLMEAVDSERATIAAALGMRLLPDPEMCVRQGYMTEASYYPGYMLAPWFKGIKAQAGLDHRYFHEDVGYWLVFFRTLALQLGVQTPTIAAVIEIASQMTGRDYFAEGRRTAASLGLAGHTAAELVELIA